MANPPSRSETSKHRSRLAPYCEGYGIDVGFGGDPITPLAIRVDLQIPYAQFPQGVQLGGDCRNLYWFADGVLDYVYSSHVLEDFDITQTVPVMKEWARVLKEGGRLILLQPDQERYLEFCREKGEPPNPHHAVDDFSLEYILQAGKQIDGLEVTAAEDHIDEYSFFVVFTKRAKSGVGSAETQEDLVAEIKRLRLELARIEDLFQTADNRLKRYHRNPLIRMIRTPWLFFRRLTRKS